MLHLGMFQRIELSLLLILSMVTLLCFHLFQQLRSYSSTLNTYKIIRTPRHVQIPITQPEAQAASQLRRQLLVPEMACSTKAATPNGTRPVSTTWCASRLTSVSMKKDISGLYICMFLISLCVFIEWTDFLLKSINWIPPSIPRQWNWDKNISRRTFFLRWVRVAPQISLGFLCNINIDFRTWTANLHSSCISTIKLHVQEQSTDVTIYNSGIRVLLSGHCFIQFLHLNPSQIYYSTHM